MRQMKDVRREIVPLIEDVCMKLTGHVNDNEVRLMLGTAASESALLFRKQLGDGPARGLWQMEPGMTGAQDIFYNYLAFHMDKFSGVIEIWLELENVSWFLPSVGDLVHHLEHYDDFACAMARLKYLRDPDPIPESLEDQAAYWLRVYNGGGKGTVKHYLGMWESCRCEELLRK